MTFKTGDVVGLRSGGPKMTVVEQSGEEVTCEWFVKTGADRRKARASDPGERGGIFAEVLDFAVRILGRRPRSARAKTRGNA